MMNEAQQRSVEWRLARLGKVTASNVYRVLPSRMTGKFLKKTESYKTELLSEILLKLCYGDNVASVLEKMQPYVSKAMQHGIDNEPTAKSVYTLATDNVIKECGFIVHPTIPRSGASPDGLIGDDGLIEIKCPTPETHLEFILNGEIHPKYYAQMQYQMACTGRKWCHFVSYNPYLAEQSIAIQIQRVERDDEFIEDLEFRVIDLIAEIDKDLQMVCKRANIKLELSKL